MPNLIRLLATKWRLHHSKNAEEDYDGPFDRPTLGCPQANRAVPEETPLEDQPPDFAKQAPRFSKYGALDSKAPISSLPTEVILEIASHTTPCSRVCLALSSKRLFSIISDGFSNLFDDLKLPAELPQDSPPRFTANDWPLMYQPERWNLLCLLQKDSRHWLACSDCFVLHPAQWFGQTEVAVWPLKRSWPQCRPPTLDHLPRSKVPRGIVDLCPCIKLTQGKKRTLLAYLQQRHQEQEHGGLRSIGTYLPPPNGPWWHECRALCSTGLVDTKLHPYLLENGGLGVITEYTYLRKLGIITPLLRVACPHCYINEWRCNLFFHEHVHSFNLPCKTCVQSRQCRYCSTRVIKATRVRELESSYSSTVTIERILSDRFWNYQTVFPFPRHTKVLYPKSLGRSPGSSIERSFPWYKQWFFNPRLLLASGWHH